MPCSCVRSETLEKSQHRRPQTMDDAQRLLTVRTIAHNLGLYVIAVSFAKTRTFVDASAFGLPITVRHALAMKRTLDICTRILNESIVIHEAASSGAVDLNLIYYRSIVQTNSKEIVECKFWSKHSFCLNR